MVGIPEPIHSILVSHPLGPQRGEGLPVRAAVSEWAGLGPVGSSESTVFEPVIISENEIVSENFGSLSSPDLSFFFWHYRRPCGWGCYCDKIGGGSVVLQC